ncbi:MAG TPA: hypothetical protein DHV72_23085 [Serratia grimesii]|uniref:Uncharacterized protein n=1 Tax=Serratia grimesii TaxID=82995 RepID=A0A9C7QYW9_9GAMM|nr:hypothetical protein [Serratia grimesii]HCK02886.1 hypothetical protein [Serratia grimesii]
MIKRFNPDFSLSISHELAYMRETPEGGYVAHGDYATLFSELELVKADRDAQQKRADALAVRNEQLMSFVTEGFNIAGQGGSWCGGDIQELGEKLELFARETYQPVLHGYICGHEPGEDSVYVITKSATSAALAAIEARGVEKALAIVEACRGSICAGGLSENRQYEESIVHPHLDGISDELESLAAELREAK